MVVYDHKNPKPYDMFCRSYIESERKYEEEYKAEGPNVVRRILSDKFKDEGLTDHGMMEYMISKWAALGEAYKMRMETLYWLQQQRCSDTLYAILEKITKGLAMRYQDEKGIIDMMK